MARSTCGAPGSYPSSPGAAAAAAARVELFETGLHEEGGRRYLRWSRRDGSPMWLEDSFAGRNERGTDADGRLIGTTHNAQRVDSIDHAYHDADRLDLLARSALLAPEECAPNSEHPSDHIPIVAQYALRRTLRVGGVELPYQPA